MLSVVVVGRNDSHGYNLSKRVASSLNSIAKPMTGNDELIFIDWNSDEVNPTFIESIFDTLTGQAQKHIVVYRIRNHIHKKLAGESKRPILEPIARNVGIRRAKNPWILSTNTDMVFNTHGRTYFEILTMLQPNLHHLFRYEIPEYIWEQFDRYDPDSTITDFLEVIREKNLYRKLNTFPFEGSKSLFPDAVGDFQLAPRTFWEAVQGFPEEMLRGWHVDSRLSVQMERVLGTKAEMLTDNVIMGFHQNHLRTPTHFHTQSSINSTSTIAVPYKNCSSWGLADLDIGAEGIRSRFPLNRSTKNPCPVEVENLQESGDSVLYNPAFVLAFLLDEFANVHEGSQIGYLSLNQTLFSELREQMERFNFRFIDLFDASEDMLAVDIVILDFGLSINSNSESVDLSTSIEFVTALCQRLQNLKTGVRVVGIRSQHWAARSLLHDYCIMPLFNNYSMILSGFARDREPRWNLFSRLRMNLKSKFLVESLLTQVGVDSNLNWRLRDTNQRINSLSHSLVLGTLYRVYKRLPFVFRRFANGALRKLLKVY